MAKFERQFEGQSNAGLRAAIRDAVSGRRCGPANEAAVLALQHRIGLTALGRATLAAVAEDYRGAHPAHRHTCDCDACYANNLQATWARG